MKRQNNQRTQKSRILETVELHFLRWYESGFCKQLNPAYLHLLLSVFLLSVPAIYCLSAIAQTSSVTPNANPPSNAPTGTTTVNNDLGNLTIEPQILTYKALSKALPLLVEKAKNLNINLDNSNIIIQTDAQEIKSALYAYTVYYFQVNNIISSCKKLGAKNVNLPPKNNPNPNIRNDLEISSISPTLNTLLSISTSIGSLLDSFRNQTTISPVPTVIEEDALVAELATILNNNFNNTKIYDPKLLQTPSGLNIIINELEPIAVCKQQIEQKPKTQEIQELSTTIDNFFNQLSGSIPETTSSSKPETTSSSSPVILNIINGAKLDEIIYNPPPKSKSYILYIGTKAGGNNRITRNFFTGTKLRSNGGVIFYYNLIDSNGIIKLSGVESFYTKFQSVPTGSVKDF